MIKTAAARTARIRGRGYLYNYNEQETKEDE